MASIVLSPVLQVILDKLASPILQRLGDMWDLKQNFEHLQHTVLMAEAILEEAEDQQFTNKAVRTWLSNLKDAVFNAEDLLDKLTARFVAYEQEDVHSISSFFMKALFRLEADEVRKMLQQLETSVMEGSIFRRRQWPTKVNRQSEARETGSFVVESVIYGRKEDKQKMVRLLTSSEGCEEGKVPIIPIIGMEGLGKTTLARLAYNDKEVKQYFNSRIWVSVSDDFDVKRIMRAVIESATGKICDCFELDVLQSKAWKLLRKKRYLIVLDDVWVEDQSEWDKLQPLLMGGVDGSKLIITTCNKNFAVMMCSPTIPYYLQCLPEEDCWNLFKNQTFPQGVKHPNLLPIGKKIVKKCGGVPLVIKTLASWMRLKTEEREWLFVQETELWKLDIFYTGILPALRFSYLHLPSHLKHCFAFCSIFPKKFVIKEEKLIQMWIAQGFIQSDEADKSLEDIGQEYFQNLLQMCFFQQAGDSDGSGVSGYTMPYIIHDLAQSITREESIILKQGLPSRSFAHIRHSTVISDFGSARFPEALHEAKRLRTHILIQGGDITDYPSTFFINSSVLRVLDLNDSGLCRLDHSIGNLLSLRYLDLSNTPISVLPYTIEKLPFLQTLNLCGCHNLVELPLIAKMKSLRHLNIIRCEALMTMLPGSQKMYEGYACSSGRTATKLERIINSEHLPGPSNQLQTLPMVMVGGFLDLMFLGQLNLRGELKIRHLENVSNLEDAEDAMLIKKGKLDSLGLFWESSDDNSTINFAEEDKKATLHSAERRCSSGPSQKQQSDADVAGEVMKGLQPHRNLKVLVVQGYPGTKFPDWELPNLIKVELTNCACNCLPVLGNLFFLQSLSLKGMPAVKYIGSDFYGEDTPIPFPSLKELVLKDFCTLQEWLGLEGRDTFPNLGRLVIEKCPKLTAMPLLLNLQRLELRDCSAILFNSITSLSSLTVLTIEKVEDNFCLSGVFFSNNILLTSLEIISCPNFHALPSDFGNLTALKSLKINWCDELSSLMQGLQNLMALESLEVRDCRSTISMSEAGVPGLRSLRSLSFENCSNLTSLSMTLEHFTCLEHLAIKNCPNLVSLPKDLHYLPALRSLAILNCPQIFSLHEELQYVTTLHCLEIRSCPGLTALPQWVRNIASLRSLTISDCQSLKELPDGLKRLTALQHLSIEDCPGVEARCKQEFS